MILLKVFLPVVKPTLAAVTLFTIVGHWNDYFSALVYITDTANYPLQTYIQQLNVDITEVTDPDKLEQLARISSRTLNSAKIVVSTIPLLMIYPFMQKYFVSGIVGGICQRVEKNRRCFNKKEWILQAYIIKHRNRCVIP